MKTHGTNYLDTFIEVAEDCPAKKGEVPPVREGMRTMANIQFDLLWENPYVYSSDDVIFLTFAEKNGIPKSSYKSEREKFFLKGQPCMRSSPLTKRYGWGIHNDQQGKIAMYGRETTDYKRWASDKSLKIVKAMRSAK